MCKRAEQSVALFILNWIPTKRSAATKQQYQFSLSDNDVFTYSLFMIHGVALGLGAELFIEI